MGKPRSGAPESWESCRHLREQVEHAEMLGAGSHVGTQGSGRPLEQGLGLVTAWKVVRGRVRGETLVEVNAQKL